MKPTDLRGQFLIPSVQSVTSLRSVASLAAPRPRRMPLPPLVHKRRRATRRPSLRPPPSLAGPPGARRGPRCLLVRLLVVVPPGPETSGAAGEAVLLLVGLRRVAEGAEGPPAAGAPRTRVTFLTLARGERGPPSSMPTHGGPRDTSRRPRRTAGRETSATRARGNYPLPACGGCGSSPSAG